MSGESRVTRTGGDTVGSTEADWRPQPVGCAQRQTATQTRVGRTVPHQTSQKAPLADSTAVLMFAASGRGARRHHTVEAIEGASYMAKRTRTLPGSDSGTQQSAVNITPAPTGEGPVTTTYSVR